MLEDYMSTEELAAVRQRMIKDALELEKEAIDILKALVAAVEDGSLRRGWTDTVTPTPFHRELQRAADHWANANNLRLEALESDAQGIGGG